MICFRKQRGVSFRNVTTNGANPGYSVFDDNGKVVYVGKNTVSDVPFLVKVSITDLNISKGSGTNYAKTGKYTGIGIFTIMEVRSGQGSFAG